VRALLAELVTLRAEQAHMRRQMEVAADERRYYDGAIGIEKAKLYITGESARAADLLVRAGLFKSASAAKKSIETKLRHRLGHVGGASDWDLLPMRQLPAARRFLVHERREAERACRRLAREQRAKERQASLKLAWPQP
jgi:hypothetical protein